MSSSAATRRASSTADREQQPPCLAVSSSSPRGHCWSVTPTTSWPCCRRSAAATLESTPPDSATAILIAGARSGRPASHRRHDRDLVGLLEGRVEALAHADVLVVEEQVDELPGLARVVEEPALEAGEPRVELIDGRTQVGGLDLDRRLAAAQAAQGSGDAEHGHFANSFG